MAKLWEQFFDAIPTINLWKWANGSEYTIDDNNADLTPELAESEQKIEEKADEYFAKKTVGKGKNKGTSKFKVEENELNKTETATQRRKEENIKDREER